MVKRHEKKPDGYYHIHGQKYKMIRGSRAQVMHDTAYKTDGTPGLTKDKLKYNNSGKIVSRRKSEQEKKERRLEKYGYYTRKGKFGAVNKHGKSHKKKHHKKTRNKKSRKN
tara:strand:+ start:8295 stop:8627 length:333 start_codon:yes stop_codon:yes gene_type:complete